MLMRSAVCAAWAYLILGVLSVVSCGHPRRDGLLEPGREIATLRFRDGLVEIRTGPAGLHYNALDAEGRLLEAGLTGEELEARFPGHFQAIDRGVAGPAPGILDASLNQEARPGSRRSGEPAPSPPVKFAETAEW